MSENKAFEQETYKKTSNSNRDLIKSFPTYQQVMESFSKGDNEVELRKRFMLKKLDETWITAIEDALPALDQIIRNPQFRLQEKEEILPVEISKHINGRSVMHLSQHTENITDIKEDGSVVPSQILNVLQEDTILTYENKFINTLVNRLYAFVGIRYNGAKDCGEDEKQSIFKLTQKFEHQDFKGKINFEIEVDQAPDEHEIIKNYVYTSDLWARMEKIYNVVNEYMSSKFITNLGKNFVRSPVLRTNTILKNPLFKDCLSLWEFIESYESTGYEALVQEDLLTVPDKLLEDIYNTIAEQYVLFQAHIENGFEDEKALDSRLLNINPSIKDEFDEPNNDEFDYKTLVPGILKNEGPLDAPSEEIELAILVALAADAMMWEDEIDEEETVIDEKGEIKYRYKYSFLARLIRAQLPTQDYYNDIKNELLSYRGVKSFLSWPRELFKQGRKQCCKLNCKGKTLFVYLPLDPNKYDYDHYHHLDVTKEGKETDYPFLLKVRSRRACKYAIELIGIVMAELGIVKNDAYVAQDYHMAPMTIEELLDKDLARLIGEYGERKHKVTEAPVVDDGFKYQYIYSFQAKVIRSGEERQEFYNEIKNYLLSFNTVKSSLSWPRELFRSGRNKVCQLKVKGKTLCVYLPLNPDNYDEKHFHHEDIRVEGKDNEFGLMIRVKSNLAVKHAKELIREVMFNLGLVLNGDYVSSDYKFAYKTLEEMLEEDLARRVGEKAPHKEVPAPALPEDDDSISYKYIFSYSARLIRSGEERQDLYNAMKNEVLSYKKVTSKISWSHELFKLGRNKIAQFKVKGKTLCVYLPLNPDNYDQEHYHFVDNRKEGKEVEFPLMMKIKSLRAVKYCSELLKDVMDSLGLVKDETYVTSNFRLAYMSIEQMLVSDPVLAKLIDGEVSKPAPVVEEVVPVVDEDVVIKDGIRYRYIYSYSARLIRSGDDRQDFYNKVKNNILSYKKVTSKISWGHELFKLGRIKICELKVKGKTLCVYLPLNPDNYDQEHYHFIDNRKEGKEVEFPLMMKVKSDRAVKYVNELIGDVMLANNIIKYDDYVDLDYKLPYMSIEEMLVSDPVLAKLVEDSEQVIPAPVIKEEPAVEPVVDEDVVIKDGIKYRYIYSYSARLIRSGEERQNFYNKIKNFALSYKKVASKISWGHELFKLGRVKICELKVKGKTLCVYLPLNPDNYDQEHYHFIDNRKEGKEVEFPLVMKIKSERAAKYACELISDVMLANNIDKLDEYEESDYKLPYMSIEEMLVSVPVLAKLVEDSEQVIPEPIVKEEPAIAPVISEDEEIVVKNGIVYQYKFSYSARLIRSGVDRQELYNSVKNEFLSYKKVTSKISWGHELFKLGRIKCGLLKVKGKTLCVYLPLNPDNYDQEHYHFIDERKEGKEVEFPLMMKVKSPRAVKYVSELINDVMNDNFINKNDDYSFADYKLKEISVEKMLTSEPPLAKLVENTNPNIVIEAKSEPVIKEEPEVLEETIETEDGINYKYKFSFTSKLILSGEEKQEFYNEIKNAILSYKKVNSKISWSHELFKLGRIKLALLKVKGKTLCVYLPLNPSNYDESRFHHKDLRVEDKEVELPFMIKVKSMRGVNYVKELMKDVMAANNIVLNDTYEPTNYKFEFMSIDKMLKMNPPLVKSLDKTVVFEANEEEQIKEDESSAKEITNETPLFEDMVSETKVEEEITTNEVKVEKTSFFARLFRRNKSK